MPSWFLCEQHSPLCHWRCEWSVAPSCRSASSTTQGNSMLRSSTLFPDDVHQYVHAGLAQHVLHVFFPEFRLFVSKATSFAIAGGCSIQVEKTPSIASSQRWCISWDVPSPDRCSRYQNKQQGHGSQPNIKEWGERSVDSWRMHARWMWLSKFVTWSENSCLSPSSGRWNY